MNTTLFNYLFRDKNIAKPNQQIAIFNVHGKYIRGRFDGLVIDDQDAKQKNNAFKLIVDQKNSVIIKCSEIVLLKIAFEDEFINGHCEYSLYAILDFLDLLSKVEIKLKNNNVYQGFVMSFPNMAGLYGMEIDLLTTDGSLHNFDFGDMKMFSLTFDYVPFLDELINSKP